MSWNNIYASYNGLGASIPTLKKLSIYGGCFCVNGVGIDINGGADVYAHGVSVDSNSDEQQLTSPGSTLGTRGRASTPTERYL
jgi:hypothetical protein